MKKGRNMFSKHNLIEKKAHAVVTITRLILKWTIDFEYQGNLEEIINFEVHAPFSSDEEKIAMISWDYCWCEFSVPKISRMENFKKYVSRRINIFTNYPREYNSVDAELGFTQMRIRNLQRSKSIR